MFDYPGGSGSTGKSILPWIYPALASVGISVDITLPILVMFEIMVLTFGSYVLLQTLFKNTHPVALIVLTCVLAMSHIRFGNLARIGNPFFHGHFYGYADGLRLFAIAYYLKGKHATSSIYLVLGFAIHPIKTMFGFVFICGNQLWKWKSAFSVNLLLPYLLFTIFAVLWAYLWLGFGQDLGAPKMTAKEFFKYSPLFNSHWYPQDLDIFTIHHTQYTTALLSSILIGFSSIIRSKMFAGMKTQLVLGILTLCAVTIIGLIIAHLETSPMLVKISLQRSTVLILSLMTILSLGQLLSDIKNKQWRYVFLLSLIVISSFFTQHTWPILITLVYASSTIFSKGSKDKTTDSLKIILFVICLFVISYELYLYTQGYQDNKYWLIQVLFLLSLIVGSVIYKRTGGHIKKTIETQFLRNNMVAMMLVFVSSAALWSMDNKTLDGKHITRGIAYKEVQQWAEKNTDKDALFMTDPTIHYGWRDFSQRSSFGTLQEWYKTGWLYSGNQKVFHEGLERARRLGIEELVPERSMNRPRSEFISKAYQRALLTFYKPDGKVLASIANDYDIQYIVMDKHKAANSGAIPNWTIAFQNKYYAILIPPHIDFTGKIQP